MITRAFVTGASGFVGGHLVAHLLELGVDVVGSARGERPRGWLGEWRQLDVRDGGEAEKVLRDVRPEVVFHLAGADRNAAAVDLFDVYAVATQQLLAAIARAAPGTRVVVAGSSAEYGRAASSELPIHEGTALRPLTPYGVSKCAQTLLALAAARAGADVIVTRTFNLVGPGEPATLVCGAFASQIAAREKGIERGPLTVGNLNSQRDFLDVRDAVRAYALVATDAPAGETYNVCSGTPTRITDVLRMLIAKARIAIEVPASAGGVPTDVPAQFGNSSHLVAATGWTPVFTLEQSLEALLGWWRVRLEGRIATTGTRATR
jgi:GDP-4-dehydro-6-deoxy-D-mannose reductase